MSRRNWTILMRRDRWQVWNDAADIAAPVEELPCGSEAAAIVESVPSLAEALRRHGYAGEGIALALSSEQCLSIGIDATDLPRRQALEAMLYRLEEKLPVAAEQVVADFIKGQKQALGVCLLVETWAPVVEAFKAAGIAVDLISPAAILALQHHIESGVAAEADAVLLADGENLDLLALDGPMPVQWNALAPEKGGLELQLKILAAKRQSPLRVVVLAAEPDALVRRIDAIQGCQALGGSTACATALATVQAARRVLAGKQPAWINLCRGPLAAASPNDQLRGPIRVAVAAGLLLWVCVVGAMAWRAEGEKAIAAASTAKQAEIFRELYAGQQVPVSVKSRLLGERRNLAGVRLGDQSMQIAPVSVLPLLYGTLKGMPADTRFIIKELQLDENNLTLDGLVTTHSSAEAIATGIKRETGMDVQPPRTETLTGGSIGFTLRGSRENIATVTTR